MGNDVPPRLAVAFVVREKFGWALSALQRLYKYAHAPFALYVVDCGYPPFIKQGLQRFLQDKQDVHWLTTQRFLYPNEALNLISERTQSELVLLLQNDVLIEPDFIKELLLTVDEEDADIVWPMTYEVQGGQREPHRDEYIDTRIVERTVEGREILELQQPWPERQAAGELPAVRRVDHFEMHTLLFRRTALQTLGPLPALNSREHLDVACGAYRSGLRVFANLRAEANYVLPPLRPTDVEFFLFRWEKDRAFLSHGWIAKRWNVPQVPSAMEFVVQHLGFAQRERVLSAIDGSEVDFADAAH